MRVPRQLLSVVFGLLLSVAAFAQVADPTRPANVPPADGETATDGVQAIILRKGGRPAAIVGGQTVHVGDRLGDPRHGKRVLKIREDAVVLKGEDGIETLRLHPLAEKTPVAMSRAGQPRWPRQQVGMSK